MKSWFFPIFFLIYLFSDQLLSVILSLTGMSVQSGMLQKIFIPIAVISYVILVSDLMKLRNPNVRKVLLITGGFAILLFLSSFTYSPVPADYTARLLRFLSICVAGVAVGIHLASYPCFDKIEKLLPFFIFLFLYVLGSYGMEAALNNTIIYEGGEGTGVGLNYQAFSYYMVIEYTYCLYFLFFSSIKGSRYYRTMVIPVAIMCIISAALCITGGGRGPFVYLVVVTLVFLVFNGATNKIFSRQMWMVPVLIIFFVLAASRLQVFDSFGFMRVSESMTEDATRPVLYAKAWASFLESPIIGHGFGSIWWTVGWPCHNMFLDLLAEGGIIGTGVVLYIFFFTGKFLWKNARRQPWLFLILVVYLEAVVENFFSGYWVSCQAIWFTMAFAITYSRKAKEVSLIK